jgi:hypothetical protein
MLAKSCAVVAFFSFAEQNDLNSENYSGSFVAKANKARALFADEMRFNKIESNLLNRRICLGLLCDALRCFAFNIACIMLT